MDPEEFMQTLPPGPLLAQIRYLRALFDAYTRGFPIDISDGRIAFDHSLRQIAVCTAEMPNWPMGPGGELVRLRKRLMDWCDEQDALSEGESPTTHAIRQRLTGDV